MKRISSSIVSQTAKKARTARSKRDSAPTSRSPSTPTISKKRTTTKSTRTQFRNEPTSLESGRKVEAKAEETLAFDLAIFTTTFPDGRGSLNDMPLLAFENGMQWRRFLTTHREEYPKGVWLVSWRKKAGKASVTYKDALDEALCFGWIDSIVKTVDDMRFMQRWCPRRKNSAWSEINKRKVEVLIASGKMTEHGLARIYEAKQNGKWDDAMPVIGEIDISKIPEELEAALQRKKKIRKLWDDGVSDYQKRLAIFRVDRVKRKETKERKAELIYEALRKGQTKDLGA